MLVELTDTNWGLERFRDGTDDVDASSVDAGLLIDGSGKFSGRGGNAFGGWLLVHPDYVELRERAAHRALYTGLLDKVDAIVEKVFAGRPTWTIQDDLLRIEHTRASSMIFRARPEDPADPLLLDHAYYGHGRPRRS